MYGAYDKYAESGDISVIVQNPVFWWSGKSIFHLLVLLMWASPMMGGFCGTAECSWNNATTPEQARQRASPQHKASHLHLNIFRISHLYCPSATKRLLACHLQAFYFWNGFAY